MTTTKRLATIYRHTCLRSACGYSWESEDEHPKRCSRCKSPYWDRPPKESVEAAQEAV